MNLKITTGTCNDDGSDMFVLACESYPFDSSDTINFIETSCFLTDVIKKYLAYSHDVAVTIAENALRQGKRFARVSDGLFVLVQFEA